MVARVWYGMVWHGMVWYGMAWYGMVWYGVVWYGMVWYGMVWYGMVWYGMVWYGMVWYGTAEAREGGEEENGAKVFKTRTQPQEGWEIFITTRVARSKVEAQQTNARTQRTRMPK